MSAMAQALTAALLDFIWQGLLVAFLLWVALFLMRKRAAQARYVMYLAPLGVGAALAVTVGSKGVGVLFGLGKLIVSMYATSALFVVLVLGAVVAIARIPLASFYGAMAT